MDFKLEIKNIYNHLEDELSKEIFENRLFYSLTDDYKYIQNITKHYIELLNDEFKNKKLVIYSAGNMSKIFIEKCNILSDIKITAVCDSDESKHGNSFWGHIIISPDELINNYNDCVIIITVLNDKIVNEIKNNLLSIGINEDKILIWKDIYEHVLGKQYFDNIITVLEDEIFIDAGCLECDTSVHFTKWCDNKYDKIIAFEPNPKQYPICLDNSKHINNITIYPYGLWNEKAVLRFCNSDNPGGAHITNDLKENLIEINAVRLDDILNGEKATFIKMDIEGAELNSLKGAEQTILKYHPKLAICVYHKPEDIWEIPSFILSLHNDYKFYIRHYSVDAEETILYAL